MRYLGFSFLVASLFLIGCGGGNGNGFTDTASIQVIHASTDAPWVDVSANGLPVFTDVAFGQATAETQVAAGAYQVAVDAAVPGGDVTVIGPVGLTFDADTEYTIVALGRVANIGPVVLERTREAVPAGSVRLQVVHAASAAPQVDVYVTGPNDPLAGAMPVGTFSFSQVLGPLTIDSGTYRIRITPAGSSTVVFDASSVELPSGGDLVIAAVDRTGAGTSPVDLIVADGTSSNVLRDDAAWSTVRVVHNSPDAPPVDVIIDNDFANPLLTALTFGDFSSFVAAPQEAFNVKVVPTGQTTPVVIDETFDLAPGAEATVIASNFLNSIQAFAYFDDRRDVATEARVRVIHGSPTAGAVDVYVVPSGTPITNIAPTLAGVLFGISSDYLAVAPGSYDVIVTGAGSKVPVIGPAPVVLDAAGVYTAVARDAQGGGLPPGLILLDDFQP